MTDTLPGPGIPFGRYRLLERIGTGGMGEIFRAEMDGPAGIKKRVVIKRVLPHLARDSRFVERFLDEGRLMVQLSHGNIVPVFDVGVTNGQYFLAMEFVDGMNLAELQNSVFEQHGLFPAAAVAVIMENVSRALEYVHTCTDTDGAPLNIVHRDISPPNLMVSLAGEVKVLDFGIARARTRVLESVPGFLVGKVGYMAPEQVQGGEVGNSIDIYGLGVVAYELLTGNLPHSGDTDIEILAHIREQEPSSVFAHQGDVPPNLGALINKCVSSDVGLRPSDAASLRQQIVSAIREDNLEGGEDFLRENVRKFNQLPVPSMTLDHVLNEQLLMDGLGQEGYPGAGGTAPIPAPGISFGSPESEDEQKSGSGGPRRGFRRWLFVAALIGVFTGLGMMLALERTVSQVEGRLPKSAALNPAANLEDEAIPGSGSQRQKNDNLRSAPEEKEVEAAAPKVSEVVEVQELDTPTQEVGEKEVGVRIRVAPSDAQIKLDRKVLGTGEALVHGPVGKPIVLNIVRSGYLSAKVEVLPGKDEAKQVRLVKEKRGRLEFRFFPARARVTIDGREINTGGSNRISREVSVGVHRVVVLDPESGVKQSRTVEIHENATRSLGTIEVRQEDAGNPKGAP